MKSLRDNQKSEMQSYKQKTTELWNSEKIGVVEFKHLKKGGIINYFIIFLFLYIIFFFLITCKLFTKIFNF